MEVAEPDIMSWLLEASKVAEDQREDKNWLSGDSRLIIVAGRYLNLTTSPRPVLPFKHKTNAQTLK
jgi:hypothetical protein